jgi:serine/threonine protein phosphatase PrpC
MGLKEMFGQIGGRLFNGAKTRVSPLFEVAVRCHTGMVRDENQDRAGVYTTTLGALFVVADGVGGLAAGAMAAEMAVEGYGRILGSVNRRMEPAVALQKATQEVNRAISDKYQTTQQSMGSTVALVLLSGQIAHVGHVGDSRVYLIRNGMLSRLTVDHSIVQKMVDRGIISDAQSRSHPDASVLTRSLGKKDVELEISEVTVARGDGLLLCSDGLWGYLQEDAIKTVACSSSLSPEEISDGLLSLALQAGGADNISVIYLKISSDIGQEAGPASN